MFTGIEMKLLGWVHLPSKINCCNSFLLTRLVRQTWLFSLGRVTSLGKFRTGESKKKLFHHLSKIILAIHNLQILKSCRDMIVHVLKWQFWINKIEGLEFFNIVLCLLKINHWYNISRMCIGFRTLTSEQIYFFQMMSFHYYYYSISFILKR